MKWVQLIANYYRGLSNWTQIASRLWHKPFGILIDATCYDSQNDPPDELYKKLELLSPSELNKQLSKIYIYNMNSTFRYIQITLKNDTIY